MITDFLEQVEWLIAEGFGIGDLIEILEEWADENLAPDGGDDE